MQELHEGGEASPNFAGPSVVASSPSVVADLTDEHYLDASEFELLFRAEQQLKVDEDVGVAPPYRHRRC